MIQTGTKREGWEKKSGSEARGTESTPRQPRAWRPGGEEKEQEARPTEIRLTARDFPNLIKDISKHIPEAQGAPDKVNTKKATPRHITGELLKIKQEDRHRRRIPFKRKAVRTTADFSTEVRSQKTIKTL